MIRKLHLLLFQLCFLCSRQISNRGKKEQYLCCRRPCLHQGLRFSVYKLSLVNDNMTRAIKLPIVYAVPEGQGRECVSVV